jgi:hypothetical protein
MILVYDKVVREHKKGHPRDIHLEQTGSFVATIPNETLIAPEILISRGFGMSNIAKKLTKGAHPEER